MNFPKTFEYNAYDKCPKELTFEYIESQIAFSKEQISRIDGELSQIDTKYYTPLSEKMTFINKIKSIKEGHKNLIGIWIAYKTTFN